MSAFVELHGDRVAADDPAVICGIGRLAGMTVALIAQERGRGGERERRRAGRMRPAGYRKALRLMRLAGHLELPLLALIDTPGVERGPDAEADGIGVVLAQSLALLSVLPVPIVSVVIGEGGSAGALALAVGDRMLMQEHAVYSVVCAEGKGPLRLHHTHAGEGDESCLNLTARECLRLGVIDAIVPEPSPAAHLDPDAAAIALQAAILRNLADLGGTGPRRLVDARARKISRLGQATAESRAATRHEVRELIDLQREALARSLGDLRGRWESRQRGLPSLPKLHMPRPDLASRVAAIRSTIGPASSVVLHEKGEPPAAADTDDNE
jgi:acetyl-CoA carboxylase carboxyl transferase subunit beta